jgi:hypothetical protein
MSKKQDDSIFVVSHEISTIFIPLKSQRVKLAALKRRAASDDGLVSTGPTQGQEC